MERVDVVVIGGGLAGLAAASAAAQGGVRSILVEKDTLPRGGEALTALSRRELTSLGLTEEDGERVLARMRVEGHEGVGLDGQAVLVSVQMERLHRHMLERARRAGMELRDGTRAGSVGLDPEGWIVELEGGEPIRAPILVIADGVRSRTLQHLGVSVAQRLTPADAEVVTCFTAHFNLDKKQAAAFEEYRIIEASGPMSRYELLPGKKGVTLAFGPVWQSSNGEAPWPSAAHPSAMRALEIATRVLNLPSDPSSIGVEEWRIGGLPCPATFDGGMVIGAAAGHRPPWPLRASHALVRQGELAGGAAAKAVLDKVWSARALSNRLGADYDAAVAPARAAFSWESNGLRQRRELPPEFWRRGRVVTSSRPTRARA